METSDSLPTSRDASRGRVLRQRFRLDNVIGEGAMGAVYRAWDLQADRACAVKMLRPDTIRNQAAAVRFCDEARIIAHLYHPHIVEMIEFGEERDGSLFLAMELLSGMDLHTFLMREPHIPLPRALDLVRQIGSALHCMHLAGVVHRDIKPRNIFLTQLDGGAPGWVKVIDFGLSKVSDAASRGSDGLIIGTPEYLPPEAWNGRSRDVDPRADQWALGVLTYHLLCGRLPFESREDYDKLAHEIRTRAPRPMRELVPDLPEHIEAAVLRALAKDKAQRFESVSEFVRALHRQPLSSGLPLRRLPGRRVDEPQPAEQESAEPSPTQPALPSPELHQAEATQAMWPPALAQTVLIESETHVTAPELAHRDPATALLQLSSPAAQSRQLARRALRFPSWAPWLLTAALIGWQGRDLLARGEQRQSLAPTVSAQALQPEPSLELRALPRGAGADNEFLSAMRALFMSLLPLRSTEPRTACPLPTADSGPPPRPAAAPPKRPALSRRRSDLATTRGPLSPTTSRPDKIGLRPEDALIH